jgi:uncharacterized protein YbjT (DUF2867 family)
MRNILVTGATGTQGGAVVDHLLADSELWEIYGLTRDATSDGAEALEARGVTVVEGDLTDADRMAELVDGMDAVYGVTMFMEQGTDVEVEQGVTLAEAAADAGVDHFVYSSVGSADADTGLPHFESKWAVEQRIEELGLPATVIRPVFFMQNFAYMMRDDIMDGQLTMPLREGVSLAVVDATDIGQAVVAALSDPDAFLGEVITLAGDDLTLEEFAAAFSDHLGHEVEPIHAGVEEYRGMAGDELADMFQWFNDVGYDIDIHALAEWGIETTSFEAYLDDSEAWQPAAPAASN